MLRIEGLHTHYGASHVLQGVDLDVPRGRIGAVLGRNGVGKTTTVRSIMGLVPPTSGRVLLDGQDIAGWPPHLVARAGVAYVPEGRLIFPDLTVLENIRVGERKPAKAWPVERLLELFPSLRERAGNRGSQLSGGEQQMLAIARALVSDPKVVLLDEPSQGLAPLVVRELAARDPAAVPGRRDHPADRAEHEAGRGGGRRTAHHGQGPHGLCRHARSVPGRGSGHSQPVPDCLNSVTINSRNRPMSAGITPSGSPSAEQDM